MKKEAAEHRLAAIARMHGADAADAYCRWIDSRPVPPDEAAAQWRAVQAALRDEIRDRLVGKVPDDMIERLVGEAVASFTACALRELVSGTG